jgi:hypothetical protein
VAGEIGVAHFKIQAVDTAGVAVATDVSVVSWMIVG